MKLVIRSLAVVSFLALNPFSAAAEEIILRAADASQVVGEYARIPDATAAAGVRLEFPDAKRAKVSTALAAPASYVEFTFKATKGVAYRFWLRGKAAKDSYSNDSIFVQFSGAVTATGSAAFRIGSTAAISVVLEDCSGCGVSGWGWNDNYYGPALPTLIYFAETGTQTLRIQNREDGLGFDQIVLSSEKYLSQAPGAPKNDSTILPVTAPVPDATDTTSTNTTELEPVEPSPAPVPGNVAPVFEADWHGFRISKTSPASGVAPVTVYFTSSATGPESGDTLTYTWNFGDGSPQVSYTRTSSEPSRQSAVHTYRAAGTYTATVTVSDQAGNRSTRSGTVTVGAPASASGGAPLKIVQWNTYKSRTTDTRTEGSKVWLMARWIAAAEADVVLLQEVMGSSIANRYKAELEAAMPGTTWSYFFRTDANGSSSSAQGIAILTRLPILTTASIAYARCADAQIQQRSAIAVSVSVNGRNVTLIDTHLSSYSGSADYKCRLSQAKQLTAWAQGFSSPQIVTGDLNETESNGAITHLRTVYDDAWKTAVSSGRATGYPDNLPSAGRTRSGRIDYVLKTKGTTVLDVLAAQIPDTRDFTNNNPVASQGQTSWAPHNYAPRASDHEMLIMTFLVK